MLGGVLPLEREGVRVSVGGVGDCYHLVQILGDADELWKIGFGHGAGGLAAMEVGAVGVVVE
jgi:hypothetical protein